MEVKSRRTMGLAKVARIELAITESKSVVLPFDYTFI